MTHERVIPAPLRSPADDKFWRYLKMGEIRIQRCTSCRRWRYPPDPLCPWCWSDAVEWVEIEGRGKLLSWATFHRSYFRFVPVPYVVAAVATVEGPIICASLTNPAMRPLRLDAEVETVLDHGMLEEGQPWTVFNWRVVSA